MMYEEPEKIHDGTKRKVEFAQKLCDEMHRHPGLLDGWALCSDYCFNVNPFYSRDMFAEFVQPYLKEILDYYRANGYYSIKHTDGNVMPILDMIVDCGPDAVHSLDPQGGVDLAEAQAALWRPGVPHRQRELRPDADGHRGGAGGGRPPGPAPGHAGLRLHLLHLQLRLHRSGAEAL